MYVRIVHVALYTSVTLTNVNNLLHLGMHYSTIIAVYSVAAVVSLTRRNAGKLRLVAIGRIP